MAARRKSPVEHGGHRPRLRTRVLSTALGVYAALATSAGRGAVRDASRLRFVAAPDGE